MKATYYINLFFLIITVLTVFINPLIVIVALILLGFIQVISALYVVSIRNTLSKKKQKLLAIYFTVILGWLLLSCITSLLHLDFKSVAILIGVIPIVLAFYFVFVTYRFNLERNNEN